MLVDFPHGFDAFDEDVYRCALRHLIWPFEMLVHAPELVYCAKIGERLDVFLVPPVRLILCINCILVVQSAKYTNIHLSQLTYRCFLNFNLLIL